MFTSRLNTLQQLMVGEYSLAHKGSMSYLASDLSTMQILEFYEYQRIMHSDVNRSDLAKQWCAR